MCVEMEGYINILNVLTWQVDKSLKLSSGKYISDISKLKTANQYALGLYNGGVQIVEIKAKESGFEFKEFDFFLKSYNV